MEEKQLSLESFSSKAKTRKDVANEYGITPKTLNNKLKKAELNIPPGYLLPNTLKKIYQTLGVPAGIMKN